MSRHIVRRSAVVAVVALLVACGGKEAAKPGESTGATPSAAPQANKPAPTGKVIPIEMTTDEKGNYFSPAEVTAHPGDVLQFKLVQGVHNVNFLADSNPGAANLPPVTAFAQLPGQTLDVPVTMAAGKTYYFQCDPHAALGMKGHVKVE